MVFILWVIFLCRCDSFGNRSVTATSSHNRRSGPGGRVRSGSTGNRPHTVITRQNHIQQQSQSQQTSQSNLQQAKVSYSFSHLF